MSDPIQTLPSEFVLELGAEHVIEIACPSAGDYGGEYATRADHGYYTPQRVIEFGAPTFRHPAQGSIQCCVGWEACRPPDSVSLVKVLPEPGLILALVICAPLVVALSYWRGR